MSKVGLAFGLMCVLATAARASEETSDRPAAEQAPAQQNPDGDAKSSAPAAADKKAKSAPAREKKHGDVPPEREAAALMFAGLHHPDLVGLLEELKQHDAKEYQRAIRELFQASERLAQIQERAPERYELELEAWKLGSHIRLLAARITMASDPALMQELRDALGRQVDIRLNLLLLERKGVETKLQKLNSTIETTQNSRTDLVDRGVKKVERDIAAANLRRKKRAERRSAATKNSNGDKKPVADKTAPADKNPPTEASPTAEKSPEGAAPATGGAKSD